VLFDEKDPSNLLEAIKPNIHVKGADRRMDEILEKDVVERNGGKIVLIPFSTKISTSDIIKKIIKIYSKK
jgi:bifunctional ADP-heptose synthase (sugar kinase/adenylyltransferase)